jgi:hypothetical protein
MQSFWLQYMVGQENKDGQFYNNNTEEARTKQSCYYRYMRLGQFDPVVVSSITQCFIPIGFSAASRSVADFISGVGDFITPYRPSPVTLCAAFSQFFNMHFIAIFLYFVGTSISDVTTSASF